MELKVIRCSCHQIPCQPPASIDGVVQFSKGESIINGGLLQALEDGDVPVLPIFDVGFQFGFALDDDGFGVQVCCVR